MHLLQKIIFPFDESRGNTVRISSQSQLLLGIEVLIGDVAVGERDELVVVVVDGVARHLHHILEKLLGDETVDIAGRHAEQNLSARVVEVEASVSETVVDDASCNSAV